jgi:hypothetical protein
LGDKSRASVPTRAASDADDPARRSEEASSRVAKPKASVVWFFPIAAFRSSPSPRRARSREKLPRDNPPHVADISRISFRPFQFVALTKIKLI